MKKEKINVKIVITAIITLGVIQVAAMHYGIDGMFRALVTGAICGAAGIAIKQPKFLIKK